MRLLFAGLSAETAQTYGLVLSAADIAHRVVRQGALWSLYVPLPQRAAAVEAVSLYLKENPSRSSSGQTVFTMGVTTYSAWYVAAVLALVHLLIALDHEQQLFADIYGADAGRIVSGELYRCITALLLHADIQHLLGNMTGLVLFGSVAAALCGWGLGWCLILASGFSGWTFRVGP